MAGVYKKEIRLGGQAFNINILDLEKSPLAFEEKKDTLNQCNQLIIQTWGTFGHGFVNQHLMQGFLIGLLFVGTDLIGCTIISKKKLCLREIIYIEFLVVAKEFQNSNLGTRLMVEIIFYYFIHNIFKYLFKNIIIMFITPNIHVLSMLGKYMQKAYPNPHMFNYATKSIPNPSAIIWHLAVALIQSSDKPHRKLQKNGLVLFGSYEETPWLIYNTFNIPYTTNTKVNAFAKKYLRYGSGVDRECIAYAELGMVIFFLRTFVFFLKSWIGLYKKRLIIYLK